MNDTVVLSDIARAIMKYDLTFEELFDAVLEHKVASIHREHPFG